MGESKEQEYKYEEVVVTTLLVAQYQFDYSYHQLTILACNP
jgi:hypothetical protein